MFTLFDDKLSFGCLGLLTRGVIFSGSLIVGLLFGSGIVVVGEGFSFVSEKLCVFFFFDYKDLFVL